MKLSVSVDQQEGPLAGVQAFVLVAWTGSQYSLSFSRITGPSSRRCDQLTLFYLFVRITGSTEQASP
jgi:hypothetical protein